MDDRVLGGAVVKREGFVWTSEPSKRSPEETMGMAFGLEDGGKKLRCEAGMRWRTGDGGFAIMSCISNDWATLGDLISSAERERGMVGR